MPLLLPRTRRWYAALAAVCAGALFLVWSGLATENQRLAEEERQHYEAERRVLADLMAETLLRQLRRVDDALLLLRGEYLADPKGVPHTIKLLRQGALRHLGGRVTLVDRAGYVAATDAPMAPGAKVYLGDRQHFVYFSSGGKDSLFINGPVQGRMTGTQGLQIARPIVDARGQFAGVVVFFMEPRQLAEFAQNLDLGPDGLLTLYSADGKVLGRSRDLEGQLGKQLTPEQFAPLTKADHGLFTRRSALDGVKRTVAFRWLEQYPLVVMVSASPRLVEEDIAAQQGANIRKGLMLTLLVFLLGAAFAYHLRRRDRLEQLLARERSHLLQAQRVAHLGSWERNIPLDQVWWSEETYRILGYTPATQAPAYEAFLAVVHPADRARVDAAFAHSRDSGAPLDLTCRLLLPGAVERYVHLGGRVERDAEDRPQWLTGTLQDISEAMRLQHALLDAEERWKFALDGAGEGVWDWYVAEQRIYLSPRWKEILGYRDEELPNRHEEWLDRLHPQDKEQALAALTDHFTGRSPAYQQEFRLRHRDGSYRWILSRGKVFSRDEAGRPLRMLGTISDISERKQAELALAKSEAMQRSLVSALAEGVVVQGQNGAIVSANAAARRILRLSEEQLLRRKSEDGGWNVIREDGSPFPGDEHPAMVTLRTGVSCDNVVMGVDRAEAGRVWLSVNSRPLVQAGSETPYAVVTSFADITDIKAAELSGRLYRDVLERAGRAILITDCDARIDNVNSAFVDLMGYGRQECLGRRAGFYRSNRHDAEFFRKMWQQLKERGQWHGEIWNRRKTGEAILVDLDIRAVCDALGNVRQYVGIFQDVTELRRSQEDMWRRAHHDPLTGLPNRSLFLERLDQGLTHARRQGERLGLLYMDLDGFKAINDRYGHQAGDALLQEVGRRLQEALRSSDTVARLAGDEFAVLLSHLTMEDDLARVMQDLAARIRQPVHWQGKDLQVGVSIGSAVFPDHADDRESLIGAADYAMYQAKHDDRSPAPAVPSAPSASEASLP